MDRRLLPSEVVSILDAAVVRDRVERMKVNITVRSRV